MPSEMARAQTSNATPQNIESSLRDSRGRPPSSFGFEPWSFKAISGRSQATLGKRPNKKVSADLSREALGLMGLTTLNFSLKSLTNWL